MNRTNTGKLVQRALIPAALFIAVFASGCEPVISVDPVTRVQQSAVLKVSSVNEAGSPSSVSIAVREYHQPSPRDQEFERFNPKHREQMYPWTQDVQTDNSGRARIVYGVTMIDRSKGNVPPPSRYPLEGRIFSVRITGRDGETDKLNLKMSEGTTAQGRSYRV